MKGANKMYQNEKEREENCFGYSLVNANVEFMDGEYERAKIHLQNAIRSLDELERMNNQDEAVEQAHEALKNLTEEQWDKLQKVMGVIG